MRLGLVALVLCGCPPTEKDSGDSPPPVEQGDTSEPTCEGTAPVLTALTVEDYGSLYPFETGDAPALLVSATGQDEDADLHRMNVILWWDDVIDGVVDTSVAGTDMGYYAMDPDPCATPEATYAVVFEVDGNRFDYTTEYEFAAEVYDDSEMVSNQLVASGVTPAAAVPE